MRTTIHIFRAIARQQDEACAERVRILYKRRTTSHVQLRVVYSRNEQSKEKCDVTRNTELKLEQFHVN